MEYKKWIQQIFMNLAFIFCPRKPCYKIARTPEEKNKIFHFRYEIYQTELSFGIPGTNHDLKMITDELDNSPNCTLFYLESKGKIIATMRAMIYGPNEAPDEIWKLFDLVKYDWMKKYSICELERFMSRKEFRGQFVMLKFIISILRYVIKNKVSIVLQYCKPYLVPHYYAIGSRPYTRHLVDFANGLWIPLIGFLDKAYAKKINSPVRFLLPDQFVFPPEYIKDFYCYPTAINFEKNMIFKKIKEVLHHRHAGERTFHLDVFKQLIDDDCYILTIEQPIKLINAGMVERTMYLVLEGSCRVGSKIISYQEINVNQLAGEFAIFMPYGKRTAEVIVENKATLFVIKESAIVKMKRLHPRKYINFLEVVISNLIYKNIAHHAWREKQSEE